MNYVDIARVWRQHNQEHADSGVVLIWDGKVYCWKNILRDPQHERPGVIAVDTEENVFIAEEEGIVWQAAKATPTSLTKVNGGTLSQRSVVEGKPQAQIVADNCRLDKAATAKLNK